MLQTAVNAADKMGGEDFVALDVAQPMPLADIFFIVTGRSDRNVIAIAEEVERELLKTGHKLLRREGKAEGRWVLCDFGDLIVHVFHQEEREYYGLERLWKDCPTVPFETPTRAGDEPDFD
ncbi:ribosome silencing factor [Microbacterium amylolyticum]|nr:ribosome silencing factor [Microbacterium amylolyticum]